MTRSRIKLLTLALAAGVASCAQPAPEAPVPEPTVKKNASAPPAKPKPVRMNGRGKVSSISLTDLFALQQSDSVLIIDARHGFFYGLGHIPGAINLPKDDCDTQIAKRETEIKAALAASKRIVVYCTNLLCPDARTVANHLARFGYPSSVLSSGWDAWKESGLPTE